MADPIIVGTRPPNTVRQADRIRYRTGTTGFLSSDGWFLVVAFVTSDQTAESGDLQTILTTADAVAEYAPGVWEVDLDSSGATTPSTQAWQVGLYHWQEFAEKASGVDRVSLRNGVMLLEKNLDLSALSTGIDLRSWARIALENVEAVIETKATKDQQSYMIAGRSLQKYTPTELMEWRNLLRSEVAREDRIEEMETDGLVDAGRNLVRF